MEENLGVVYTEVSKILSLMNKKYINKIPIEILKFINEQKLHNYETSIVANKPLRDQNIQRKTLEFLAFLDLNYWCNEEEKQKLVETYKKNIVSEKEANKLLPINYKKDKFIIRILKRIANIFSKK